MIIVINYFTIVIAERFPGSLSYETLSTMRKSLLSTAGEEEQEQSTKPIAVLYYRQVLAKKTAGAQSRELLNLATAIDLLLRGRASHALDVLTQRLKAQESVSQGTQWSVAQRIEVPVAEHTSLLQRSELVVNSINDCTQNNWDHPSIDGHPQD